MATPGLGPSLETRSSDGELIEMRTLVVLPGLKPGLEPLVTWPSGTLSFAMCNLWTMKPQSSESDPSMAGIDLESVDRVLETTRSVRRRIDFERPIDPEVIERGIEIAGCRNYKLRCG